MGTRGPEHCSDEDAQGFTGKREHTEGVGAYAVLRLPCGTTEMATVTGPFQDGASPWRAGGASCPGLHTRRADPEPVGPAAVLSGSGPSDALT